MNRPGNVPDTAQYDENAGYWYDGDFTSPAQRMWASGGNLMLEAHRRDGKLHGELTWSPAIDNMDQAPSRDAIAKELGLADGPDNTQIATYDNGTLVSVRFRPGLGDYLKDTLVATLEAGVLTKLEWKISGTVDQPLFALGATVIKPEAFKIPKPWPKTLVANFIKGKLATHAYFDANGKQVGVDKPLEDWGADITPEALTGYVERGELVADAKRFFPKMAKLVIEGLPKKLEKLAKLPAAKALETAVRKKQLPVMGIVIDFAYFGPDCAELAGITDPAYVVVGADGSGDMYLLDTNTGRVHIYRHEEGTLDEKAFDSLDAFAFAALRAEAAMRDMIPKDVLQKTFDNLGIAVGKELLS